MLIIGDCSSNPSMRQCLVTEGPNIKVIVAWGSIQLIDKVSTVMFQLWHKLRSMFRNVSPFTVLSGKKYGPYTFDVEMAQNTCFRRITFIFNKSVRLLSPPDTNILLVHFSTYVECSLIVEPQPF